jgi:hypothetical protein
MPVILTTAHRQREGTAFRLKLPPAAERPELTTKAMRMKAAIRVAATLFLNPRKLLNSCGAAATT